MIIGKDASCYSVMWLRQLPGNWAAGGFRQQNLYRGGPVSDSTLYVLHGHCISDAFQIVDVCCPTKNARPPRSDNYLHVLHTHQ